MHRVIEAPASIAARSGAKFKDFCSRRTGGPFPLQLQPILIPPTNNFGVNLPYRKPPQAARVQGNGQVDGTCGQPPQPPTTLRRLHQPLSAGAQFPHQRAHLFHFGRPKTVRCLGGTDPLQPFRRPRTSGLASVHPAAVVRHRRTLARSAAPRPCPASGAGLRQREVNAPVGRAHGVPRAFRVHPLPRRLRYFRERPFPQDGCERARRGQPADHLYRAGGPTPIAARRMCVTHWRPLCGGPGQLRTVVRGASPGGCIPSMRGAPPSPVRQSWPRSRRPARMPAGP